MRLRGLLGLLLVALHCSAAAAWHDKFAGDDIRVHYVRMRSTLTPRGKQFYLHLLQSTYDTCASIHALNKWNYAPLGPLPEEPFVLEWEAYYAKDKNLVAAYTVQYSIDQDGDCHLRRHDGDIPAISMTEGYGACNIDLVKRKMTGNCNGRHVVSGDFSKLSPEQRALLPEVERAVARMKETDGTQDLYRVLVPGTGTYKSILGHRCELYPPAMSIQECIAHPDSSFAIPAAKLISGIAPGLMLEYAAPLWTMTAREVKLELDVSRRMFEVPDDIRNSEATP